MSAPRFDRRTALRAGLLAGGSLSVGGLLAACGSNATPPGPGPVPTPVPTPGPRPGLVLRPAQRDTRRPNILVILVDQMRGPQDFPASSPLGGLTPNLALLRNGAVSFERHYTAANDCTPARSTLLTGLYSHQTGCMITGTTTLDPRLPTWGGMLRDVGYRTRYYGKWHLTSGDNRWTALDGPAGLEAYGFGGGTFPSPDGSPGQGSEVDPQIAGQFEQFMGEEGGREPWCTTVSFVNPHDIVFWYLFSSRIASEARPPATIGGLPANFETPADMRARQKPRLQLALQDTAAASFGPVPFTGPELIPAWLPFLDLYVDLQRRVDTQIGRVLAALAARPEVERRTVVVMTSDHGEYGASHGMRGKGASAYEEAIRVPLIVRDPRPGAVQAPALPRRQLTSSVDVAPLLLTLATGSDAWRREPRHAHIARRLDLSKLLVNPSAPGRPYVLHATDEEVTEFAREPYAASAPLHVVGLRTARAKYAEYSRWAPQSMSVLPGDSDTELYDYLTPVGQAEVDNAIGRSPLEVPMRQALAQAIRQELQEPLPEWLLPAQAAGLANYVLAAEHASNRALAAHEALSAGHESSRRRRREVKAAEAFELTLSR